MSHKMKKGKREKIRKKLKKELGDYALPTGRPVILQRFIDIFKVEEGEKKMGETMVGELILKDKLEEFLHKDINMMLIGKDEAKLFVDLLDKDINKNKEEKNMADGSYNMMEKSVVRCEQDLSENVEAYDSEKDAAEYGMDMVRRSERNGKPIKIEYLYDTSALMCSHDYRTRFVAEYYQTKIRYEKLKAFNTKIEAANRMMDQSESFVRRECKKVDMPRHDCPDSMLRAQERAMEDYLHILELRAVIEGINLEQYK